MIAPRARSCFRHVLALAVLLPVLAKAEGPPTPEWLVQASIAYHDPSRVWSHGQIHLVTEVVYSEMLIESRGLEHPSRIGEMWLAPAWETFRYRSTTGEHTIEYGIEDDRPWTTLDGRADFTDAEREAHGIREPYGVRDYYEYVFGLPMKLRDRGVNLDPEVERMDFHGRDVWKVRVTYDADVGSDVWDFFFDHETYALVASRFYHDETANDGEFILYAGEVVDEMTGLRLPATHDWYYNDGRGQLAIDHVRSMAVTRERP